MSLDERDYKNLTDYLQRLYGCQPFTRAGIEHPVHVFAPEAGQVYAVDSLLASRLPHEPQERAFPAYDDSTLRDLLNRKPGLRNGSTFILQEIREKPLQLHGAMGRYFDMLATCAALEGELRAAAQGWMHARKRATYHRHVQPEQSLHSGRGRSAAIGISTLTVFNDGACYRALLARRSSATALDEGMFHVLPAMMFGPTTAEFKDPREWSVQHQIFREILEELYNLPEQHQPSRWDYFYGQPALRRLQAMLAAGSAQLCATGILLNLLTLRPEIATVLIVHDPTWLQPSGKPAGTLALSINDETMPGTVIAAPINSDRDFLRHFPRALHLQMPVHATAAMWLGIDRARIEIARHS